MYAYRINKRCDPKKKIYIYIKGKRKETKEKKKKWWRIYNARLDTVPYLEGGNGIRWTVACEKIVAKKIAAKIVGDFLSSSCRAVARLAHVVAIRAPPLWKIDATGRPSDDLGPVPTDAATGCRVPSCHSLFHVNIAVSTMMTRVEARFDSITRATTYTAIPCKAVRK